MLMLGDHWGPAEPHHSELDQPSRPDHEFHWAINKFGDKAPEEKVIRHGLKLRLVTQRSKHQCMHSYSDLKCEVVLSKCCARVIYASI